MNLKFCGAAGTVTGSSHLLTLDDGFTILLDCGLYQGDEPEFENFNDTFLFDPKTINVVVLSHAHIDHCGKLPKLVKDGYSNPIYSTPATQDLTAILLLDSAHIQERESEFTKRHPDEFDRPLYEAADVKKTLELFRTIGYNQWFSIHPDVQVLYKDSGHILGAASVTLKIRNQKSAIQNPQSEIILGFTADIGRPNRPILRDPDPMPPCDYLICESTYGDRLHPSQPQEEEKLLQIVTESCVKRKGKLIIPAFSVGRTQEIVYMLDQLSAKNKLPNIPIYIDSPLSINATHIFQQHPECYDNEILAYLLKDSTPFGFKNLKYVATVEESKHLNDIHSCVIISASGMINAGRVKHHVFNSIENPDNTILLVGYSASNTPGGKLLRGDKTIKLFGKLLSVNARIEKMESFSAHGDYAEMLGYLSSQQKQKLKTIFLVHGEKKVFPVWSDKLLKSGFSNTKIPVLGEVVSIQS